MSYVIKRLKEPTTYLGLAGFIATLSFLPHAQEIAGVVPDIGKGIAGLLTLVGIFMPEAGNKA